MRVAGIAGVGSPKGVFVRNSEFYRGKSVLEFFGEVGRGLRVNDLLRKESIKNRMGTAEGLSLNEFMYTVVQGYDFLKLFERENCWLQMGGSDQFGNISSGITLIRKTWQHEAMGVTLKLLTTADGKKLGKSEGNAISLDSPAPVIYHYLVNQPDQIIPDLFHQLTLHAPPPLPIKAQKHELALRVCEMLPCHGQPADCETGFFGIDF